MPATTTTIMSATSNISNKNNISRVLMPIISRLAFGSNFTYPPTNAPKRRRVLCYGSIIHRDAAKGYSRKLGFRFYLFLRNSTLLSQHYDRYLPFGLTLVVGVSWIRFYEARPQP